jgi:hypothetical protein
MSSLRELEQDVFQFLSTLANVRKVDVEASVSSRGRKLVKATTFVATGDRKNRFRVYQTEQYLMDRHRNVEFDFSCTTLKDDHASTVGTTETPRVSQSF